MLTAEAVRNFGNVSDDQQTIRKKIELPFIRILEIEIPEKNKKQIFNLKINAPHFSHFSEIIFGFYCSTMSGIYLWRCMQHVDFLTKRNNRPLSNGRLACWQLLYKDKYSANEGYI